MTLIVAAAWLTNIPSAVMLTYSLALLLIIVAIMRRSSRPLVIGAVALLLGLALAAFYVVPVLYEQKWVEIAQVLSPGVRPQDNFLFTSLNNPDHDRFNLLISCFQPPRSFFWPSSVFCHAPGVLAPRSCGGCFQPGPPPAHCSSFP